MKLAHPQLEQHLTKTLASVYVISGDELLLTQEAADLIRKTAQKSGYTERTRITDDANWEESLYENSHSLSLFSTKKILELDMREIKLNQASSKILENYFTKPSEDIVFILQIGKLDSKTEKTNWFKTLEENAVIIPIWPIPLQQLPQWITQRAKKINFILTPEKAKRLAEQVEGNLLAAAQEIEKLALLPADEIESFTDLAHFTVFDLVDSALAANHARALRILDNLAAEGIEPTLILWALTRELRTLTEMINQTKQGVALSLLFNQFRIWEARQTSVRSFLKRNTSVKHCWACLTQAAQIDQVIKGAELGNIWVELQRLVLKIMV